MLLVEDDVLIANGICNGLRGFGIEVTHAATASDAEAIYVDDSFAAVVLDLGLPDAEGLGLISVFRSVETHLPVLILSARDAIEFRVAGLQGGADDYLVKPFDLRELAARLYALVRRTQGRASQTVAAGPLKLEPASGLAWLDGNPVTLSRREIDLLTELASADGRWVSPEALVEKLFGLATESGTNTLNVHIHNVRRKLGSEAISTARGMGYRLGWALDSDPR